MRLAIFPDTYWTLPMTIDPHASVVPTEPDADAEKLDVVRDIKRSMDDMAWRSIALGSTILKQYELTLHQALALSAIVRLGPDVDMGHVAESTLLAPSTTTSVVDRLLHRGLISRSSHPTDRRRVLVSATRNGHYLVQEMDEQDLNSFIWMSRGLSNQDLKAIQLAFHRWLIEVKALKQEDFFPGGRFARNPAEGKTDQ